MSVVEKKLRVDPGKAYKQRVRAIKKQLPLAYKEIIFINYPQYNTEEGRALITYVVNYRAADVALTEILERIASGELKLKS